MILEKLVLENFRQFRGRHEMQLADPSRPDQNVTVIFGENGRGKTGLFRAVSYCLFGDRKLTQDGDVPLSELQLVNSSALQDNVDGPVSTLVELHFSHRGERFLLKRAISGMLHRGQVLEEVGDIRLLVTGREGNTQNVKPQEIQQIINSILDPRVKDYFLFDGEKIERLTRATVEQRQEISRGIRNLLSVDSLETAIKCLRKVAAGLDKELANSSSEDLVRLLGKLGECEAKQASHRERLEELAAEIGHARKEMAQTDRELAKITAIRHLLSRRQTLQEEARVLDQRRREALSNMRSMVPKATLLILGPTLSSVYDHFEQRREKGDIPSAIRRDLIERLLSEAQCICGRGLCRGTEEYYRILAWRERTPDDTSQNAALSLWRYLSDVVQHQTDCADAVERSLLEYGTILSSIDVVQRNLEQVRNEIGGREREDASRLDAHRNDLESKIIELETEARTVQLALADLQREEERLKALLKEEKLKVARTDELSRRCILARDTLDALAEVHRRFTQEVKDDVGKAASEYLVVLLDGEGRENLRSVVINEDYSLQVLDRWNRPFLANISAGQRQVVSVAFIAALARKAARSEFIDIPLFMDTPFGRLSSEHRKNMISLVPGFASQWILLATDTEFRRQEASLLRSSGRWARFYLLSATRDGNTQIEEHDLDSVPALLTQEVTAP